MDLTDIYRIYQQQNTISSKCMWKLSSIYHVSLQNKSTNSRKKSKFQKGQLTLQALGVQSVSLLVSASSRLYSLFYRNCSLFKERHRSNLCFHHHINFSVSDGFCISLKRISDFIRPIWIISYQDSCLNHTFRDFPYKITFTGAGD